tara:strand:- start:202 stop:849 length:648 start_codon:yes stop_codon:yes gene_type:complete
MSKENTICFIINGMRRSGLHCIVNDIILHYNFQNKINLLFKNDVNLIKYNNLPKNHSVFLFEDQLNVVQNKMRTQFNIIIIRDIYDNIISRIKKSAGWSKVNKSYLKIMKKILKEILGITNTIPDKIIINYNLYISNHDYRISILKQFGISDIKPFSKEIPHYGGGRTFKPYEKRENVIINKDIYDIIKNDLEFLELVRKYYNYDLIQKLDKHIY